LFSTEGFGVSVRRVAAAAGVSPGLVIHHFGSKEGLKEVCDQRIGEVMLDLKSATMAAPADAAEANLLHQLANADSYSYVLGYLLRALSAGGEAARSFVQTMTEATERLLERGVAAGTMVPSRDPAARARYLTCCGIGALMVWQAAQPQSQGWTASERVKGFLAALSLPSLELCTDGLFTNSALLDAYLAGAANPDAANPNAQPDANANPSPDPDPDPDPANKVPPNDQDD
jgi:AcrR family transcriptional regulator